ncbi:MAG: ABC transporter ATP-binding protein [Planctomycetota bacterium]
MSDPLLVLDDVHTSYGAIKALKGISLTVHDGETVAVIGANGAGKSTMLMTISGIVRSRAGRILFGGEPIERRPSHEIVDLGISQVPEGRHIFPRLTVKENLEMGAYPVRDRSRIDAALRRVFELFPILEERIRQQGGTLSGGEQQMLAVGRALMVEPRLLLLDEPSLGLDPLKAASVFRTIRELKAAGKTILLVEQNAHQALRIADRAYVMETGTIVMEGPGKDLLGDPAIRAAYLGE